ncbi:major facilitator superfamily domain-containing protein [Mycena sp. CBHHK59/15]|nr:major facilitator superfamily domain-containing protein [Mycena sp. CBHHK59/15]
MDTKKPSKKGDDVSSGLQVPTLKTLNASSASLDEAIVYLQNTDIQKDGSEAEDARLLRKIDRRIVPIALAIYTLQFLDKYAAVMGLNQDLKLVGNDFNNLGSAMYIANLVAELPTGYIVQKVRPGKWLGINVILWGLVTACSAAATNYHGMLACRILVGALEAATAPCLMLITGMWYTKSEAILRFAIWYCGLGIAQMMGSLVSWGFQLVKHDSLAGWRIMFIVLGGVTVAGGAWTFMAMPDSPMEAKWLTDVEKRDAIQRVAVNQTGIKNTHFKWQHMRELATDPQIWLLTSIILLFSMSSGVVSFYSTTLIRNFGFSALRSALLNMPSGAVSLVACLVIAYLAHKQANRTRWLTISACLAAIGSGLMSFLPKSQKAGLLAGIYLVNIITVTLYLIFCLTTANVAGQTKRVVANALVAGSFSVGNIIGPQLFKPKDAPEYIPAKIVLLVTQLVAAALAVILQLYYGWQNKKKDAVEQRERESGEFKEVANMGWLNLTDKENKTFRYKY